MKKSSISRPSIPGINRLIGCCLLAAVLSACINELYPSEDDPQSPLPAGKVRLNLITDAPVYSLPAKVKGEREGKGGGRGQEEGEAGNAPARVGTAQEDHIQSPWVLVFTGSDGAATFSEAVQSVSSGTTHTVTLSKTENPCMILIVANPPASFYNAQTATNGGSWSVSSLASALTGKTLAQASALLCAPQLDSPQTTVPYTPSLNIPMAGLVAAPNGITASTKLGEASGETGPIQLTRMVAKITVVSTASGFTLQGATVVNVPKTGMIYRHAATLKDNSGAGALTAYYGAGAGLEVTGVAPATGNSTASNPIYVYECRKEEVPAIILKGTWNGTTGYYKIATNNNSNQPIDLVRNKHYTYTITNINGAGYPTVDAAVANPANTLNTLTVTDQSSHDLIGNGAYYLGLSNSELIVYDDAAQTGIVAVRVTTDATATTLNGGTNSIALSSGGGIDNTGLTVTTSSIALAATEGSTAYTDVLINMAEDFTSAMTGNIKITLGNLVKVITVKRATPVSAPGGALQLTPTNIVGAMIENRGSGNWLSLSTDGATESLTTPDEYLHQEPDRLYIKAPTNVGTSGMTKRTGGIFYYTRTYNEGSAGRTKILASQKELNLGSVTPPTTLPANFIPYVGAFWRNNQTGERIIRIPNEGATAADFNNFGGGWTAIALDPWIVLSTTPSSDGGITWNTANESPANMIDNDAIYRVTDGSGSVSGTLTQGGFIYFRIGLTGVNPNAATEDDPFDYGNTGASIPAPRYGRVLLRYKSNSLNQIIYIRQGEAADYVFRPGDTATGGDMSDGYRTLAAKFSPYNLTASNLTDADQYKQITVGTNNVFVNYPTQAGAFFQWANATNPRYAYHPVNPVGSPSVWNSGYPLTYWTDASGNSVLRDTHETCPAGYRRMTSGQTDGNIIPNASESELIQSLFYSTFNGPNNNTNNTNFRYWGFYADGYYDRRSHIHTAYGMSGVANTGVNTTTKDIAYIGQLFTNPANNASLFFPASGNRRNGDGTLYSPGYYGTYWSSSSYYANICWRLNVISSNANQDDNYRSHGLALRCVRL